MQALAIRLGHLDYQVIHVEGERRRLLLVGGGEFLRGLFGMEMEMEKKNRREGTGPGKNRLEVEQDIAFEWEAREESSEGRISCVKYSISPSKVSTIVLPGPSNIDKC